MYWLRLLMSFVTVLIHCYVISEERPGLTGYLSCVIKMNMLVTFFFSTGFFGFREMDLVANPSDRIRALKRLKKIISQYSIWFVLYLPLAVYGEIVIFGSSGLRAIAKIGKTYLLFGSHYYSWQLWFMHGLVVAVALMLLCMRRGLPAGRIMGLGAFFFVAGRFLPILQRNGNPLAEAYFLIFTSNRNGLLLGWFIVAYGYWAYKREREPGIGLLLAVLFGSLTMGLFLPDSDWYEFIGVVSGLALVELVLQIPLKESRAGALANELSKVSYFVHMLFVALFELVLRKGAPKPELMTSLGVFIGTYALSFLLVRWKQQKSGRWLYKLF